MQADVLWLCVGSARRGVSTLACLTGETTETSQKWYRTNMEAQLKPWNNRNWFSALKYPDENRVSPPALPLVTSLDVIFPPSIEEYFRKSGKGVNYSSTINESGENQACWNISDATRLVRPLLSAFHRSAVLPLTAPCIYVPAFMGQGWVCWSYLSTSPFVNTLRILLRSQRCICQKRTTVLFFPPTCCDLPNSVVHNITEMNRNNSYERCWLGMHADHGPTWTIAVERGP